MLFQYDQYDEHILQHFEAYQNSGPATEKKKKEQTLLTMFSVTPRQDMVYVANMTGNKRKPLSFLKK